MFCKSVREMVCVEATQYMPLDLSLAQLGLLILKLLEALQHFTVYKCNTFIM